MSVSKSNLFLIPVIAMALFTAVRASALDVGGSAPCVILNDIQVDGSEVQQCIRTRRENQKFTLIEFFSAVCSDCQKNLPVVSGLAQDIESTTTVRLVGVDRDESLLRNYIKEHSDLIRFPVALDVERDAKKAYGVVATPTLFLLDSTETVIFKHQGVLSTDDVAKIKELVK